MHIIEKNIIHPISALFIKTNELELSSELLENFDIIYQIFTKYFHNLGLSKPSIKSIKNLINKVPCNNKIIIKKDFIFNINGYVISLCFNN